LCTDTVRTIAVYYYGNYDVLERDVTYNKICVGNCMIHFLLVMILGDNDLSQLILNFALHDAVRNSPRKSGRTETKRKKSAANIY
jgi:hypothetical protein